MIHNLAGAWKLKNLSTNAELDGQLPGCNYLDYLNAKLIPDPFDGILDKSTEQLADSDFRYTRAFAVSQGQLDEKSADFVSSGLDTIASVSINGKIVLEANNAFRTWRAPAKEALKVGDNEISITFKSPTKYALEKNSIRPFSAMMVQPGVQHLRKPPCHFGWDWGPVLPPSGIFGDVGIDFYSVRIDEVKIAQIHESGKVTIRVQAILSGGSASVSYILKDPDGAVVAEKTVDSSSTDSGPVDLAVKTPKLWNCNGLGPQPLYELEASALDQSKVLDTVKKTIGLRTIELNTKPDDPNSDLKLPRGNKPGTNFQFVVNGVPIFAKGADWIPSDSFVTRTTPEQLELLIKSAAEANMNMLRVWGGGHYESDLFYDLCDKYGILVWQDCAFACIPYPLDEEEYVANVMEEIADNVKRLRHRASLALWCGNNEIQILLAFSNKKKPHVKATIDFFYNRLKAKVKEYDQITPYWAGSPDSGSPSVNPNSPNHGDTHLWQVWHGMRPVEFFSTCLTRFCSEFGMESFPAMETIKKYAHDPDLNPLHPVIQSHQKSVGGNEKIIYYILTKYHMPEKFEDFVYLSQIIQSETVKAATESWRINKGRCNGAIFWQYNDCWPVASWSAIDYFGKPKAVLRKSKTFNAMLNASVARDGLYFKLYVLNDYGTSQSGSLKWQVKKFSGEVVSSGNKPFALSPASSALTAEFSAKKEDALTSFLELQITQGARTVFETTELLTAEKNIQFPKPDISASITSTDTGVSVTLTSKAFARHVTATLPDLEASDSFFDLVPGKPKTVTFAGADPKSAEKELQIKSFADLSRKGTNFSDWLTRTKMLLIPRNFFSFIIFKLLMG
jgi:beta-mannosidase